MSDKTDIKGGWVIIDKPLGRTSTQMVGAVRRAFGIKKVGHAGTLDPLATGVVPIAIGEATKTVAFAQDYKKAYEFRVQWGENRDTQDAEGKVTATSDIRPTRAQIEAVLPEFIGDIQQIPPQFSAIKIDGQRAYDLARKGEEIELKARTVTVDELEITEFHEDWVDLRLHCGKGTYVRSIARDLAEKLGTCGYVSVLRRLYVGPFSIDDAISLDFLEKHAKNPLLEDYLLPIEKALDDILVFPITQEEASKLAQGLRIRLISKQDLNRFEQAGVDVDPNKETLALARTPSSPFGLVKIIGTEVRPERLFNL